MSEKNGTTLTRSAASVVQDDASTIDRLIAIQNALAAPQGRLAMSSQFKDRINAFAAEARAKGLWLAVLDVRYITCGVPSEITEEYIYFGEEACWELDNTGKLKSHDATGEAAFPKFILWSAVIHVEFIHPMKAAK